SIDFVAVTAVGVIVITMLGANWETVVDHALAMILAAVQRIVEHDASVHRGEWNRAGALTPWDLHSTTVSLVGYGEIGRAVARRLRGFGVRLLVSDPALAVADGEPTVGLPELLETAGVVSLHLPRMAPP